jgi:crotonobetainyl-CoA:carnitine CoA-transferase CaiB-like acyl-CoA transferase
LYKVAGPDERGRDDGWVAIAVATDEQWCGLRSALGDPAWAADPELATMAGRRRAHDRIDGQLGEWCRARSADDIVTALWEAGVPVGKVMQPHEQPDLPQLAARGFFEEVAHPVIGASRYSTLPMRFSRGPGRLHHRHAPLLGEHNGELLTALGLSAAEIEALEADGIIGGSLTQGT